MKGRLTVGSSVCLCSGYKISFNQVQKIRQGLGIQRRVHRTREEKAKYYAEIRDILDTLLQTGVPAQYGKEYFSTYLKQRGLNVARDTMHKIIKELDPEGVASRTPTFKKTRDKVGRYVVPGPNYVWSVDGHLKLDRFGFGIYAMVDGYSRYIVSWHVGVSVTTGVSVLKQFAEAVLRMGLRPVFIRSDRGTETMLMANAQFILSQSMHPDVSFKDIYRYGTSKANSRVESWWEKSNKGQLKQWRACILHSKLLD